MDKKLIKELEEWEIIFHVTTTLPVSLAVLSWLKGKWKKITRNIPESAEEALERMMKDPKFIKVIDAAIDSEGGIHDFELKRRGKIKMRSGDDYFHDYWTAVKGGYTSQEWKNYVGEYLPNVLEKIIKSKVVQDYFKKFELSKSEQNNITAALYYALESPAFKKTYEKLLRDAGMDVTKATREMNDAEKRRFFGLDDNKISLKKLLPKNI